MYAYVTSITKNIDIPMAIVLASSLKNLTKYQIIIMVTKEITTEARHLLRMFYDKIIDVSSLDKKNKYINYNAFKLDYRKVILLDINSLITKKMDHLFDVPAPAGYFLHSTSYYTPLEITKNSKGMTILNNLLVIEPNKQIYREIIKDIKKIKDASKKWTTIPPLITYGYKYTGLPYELKDNISEKMNEKNYVKWFELYQNILLKNPELNHNELLKEANETNKFFTNKIPRGICRPTNMTQIDIIADTFGVAKEKINPKHETFYFLDFKTEYHPTKCEPMFDNILPFEYFRPIKLLANYFNKSKSNYYMELAKKYDIETNNKRLDELIKEDPDEIILQYIKCRPTTRIIITDEIPNIQTQIYYIKKYQPSKFFTNILPNKKEYYAIVVEGNPKENYFITENFCQTIEYAQILFNQNTLDYANFNHDESISSLKIMTTKKWLYSSLSLLEITRLCTLGDIIFHNLGIKEIGNIKGFIVNTNSGEAKNQELLNLAYVDLYQNTTKIFFINIGIEGTHLWKEKWDYKYKSFLDKINVSSLDEIALNPKHHYYINGIKTIKPQYELYKKTLKMGPKDYADFIATYFKAHDVAYDFVYLDNHNKLKFKVATKGQIINNKFMKSVYKYIKMDREYKYMYYDVIKDLLKN